MAGRVVPTLRVAGFDAVIAIRHEARTDRDSEASFLAARLAEYMGSELITVPDIGSAGRAVAGHDSPVVVVTMARHALVSMPRPPLPAILVGSRCEPSRLTWPLMSKVLACLDGSPRAEAVLPVAAASASAFGVDLALLHVASLSGVVASSRYPSHVDVLEANYLARVAAGVTTPGVRTTWEVLHGDRAAALVDYARASGAGLLALNTHGSSASPRAAHGRVAARVVMRSPIPVLLTGQRTHPQAPAPARRSLPSTPRRAAPQAPVTLPAAARIYRSVSAPSARDTPHAVSAAPLRPIVTAGVVLTALVLLLAVIGASLLVPLDYYAIEGDVKVAHEMVRVTRPQPDHDTGTILVPVVETRPVTGMGALRGWLDGSVDVKPDEIGHVRDSAWARRRGQELMTEGAGTARWLALRHLGLDPDSVEISVDARGLGGPSAALALALETVDLLSAGDLTGGRVVAATGALNLSGRVEAVGGIRYKAFAARRAGAHLFLVPPGNYDEAVASAPGLRVVAVESLDDALAILDATEPAP